jgi:hypothetical protein
MRVPFQLVLVSANKQNFKTLPIPFAINNQLLLLCQLYLVLLNYSPHHQPRNSAREFTEQSRMWHTGGGVNLCLQLSSLNKAACSTLEVGSFRAVLSVPCFVRRSACLRVALVSTKLETILLIATLKRLMKQSLITDSLLTVSKQLHNALCYFVR